MATSNAELAAQYSNKGRGKDNRATSQAPSQDTDMVFSRNLLLQEGGSGINVGDKGEAKDRSVVDVRFNAELQHQYTTFLENYIKGLAVLRDSENRGVLDRPEHKQDLLLLNRLRVLDNPDKAKIRAFLSDAEGWMITTQLMERQTAYKLFALGLTAAINPDAARTTLLGGQVIETGIDKGAVREFMQETIFPHAKTAGKVLLEGNAILSSLGFLAKVGISSASLPVAGAGMAILPAFAAIRSYADKGLLIDVQQSVAALQAIKSQAGEAEFLWHTAGINVSDLNVNAAGNGIERANGAAQSLDLKDAWKGVLSNMYARQNFYHALGVPLKELDAIPEQFLFRYNDVKDRNARGVFEQTGVWWEKRAMELFNSNYGGIRDTHNRGINDPGFDRDHLDTAENIKRFDKARRAAILEMTQKYLARTDSRESPSEQTIALLDVRERSLREGGIEVTKKQAEIDKKVNKLNESKAGFTELQTKTTVYEAARRELQELQEAYTREFGPGMTVDQRIAVIENDLNAAGTMGTLAYREQNLLTTYNTELQAANTDASAHLHGLAKQPKDNTSTYDSFRKQRLNPIEKSLQSIANERTDKEAKITRLKALKDQMQTKEDAVRAAAGETLSRTQEKRDQFSVAHTELLGWGLTPDDLTHKSLKELLTKVNTAHTAWVAAGSTPPQLGWPEAENENADNVMKVRRAMVEAKALAKEAYEPSPANQRQQYRNVVDGIPAGGGAAIPAADRLNTEQLIGWSNEDLMSKLVAATPGGYGWLNTTPAEQEANRHNLELARAEARRTLVSRVSVLVDDQVGEIARQVKELEKEKGDLKFDKEANAIMLARTALGRRGEVYSRTLDEMFKGGTGLLDTTVIAADTPGYTAAEAGESLPKGYYEIVNLVFNYKEVPPDARYNREKLFESVKYLLPPDELAKMLNDTLHLSLTFVHPGTPAVVGPPAVPATPPTPFTPSEMMESALTRIKYRMSRRSISPHTLYSGIRDIMSTVEGKAKAIGPAK